MFNHVTVYQQITLIANICSRCTLSTFKFGQIQPSITIPFLEASFLYYDNHFERQATKTGLLHSILKLVVVT